MQVQLLLIVINNCSLYASIVLSKALDSRLSQLQFLMNFVCMAASAFSSAFHYVTQDFSFLGSPNFRFLVRFHLWASCEDPRIAFAPLIFDSRVNL